MPVDIDHSVSAPDPSDSVDLSEMIMRMVATASDAFGFPTRRMPSTQRLARSMATYSHQRERPTAFRVSGSRSFQTLAWTSSVCRETCHSSISMRSPIRVTAGPSSTAANLRQAAARVCRRE